MDDQDTARNQTGAAEPIVAAYREKILYALALVGALVVAPFSIGNFIKGYLLIGCLSMAVVLVFVADAIAIYLRRRLPVPIPAAFALVVAALAIAVWERGLLGIFWSFPAILLFHFVLERRIANLFNATFVAVVGGVAFYTMASDVALRIVAGQLLTIVFTNIFSYVVEAEQRKEAEQRRRLGLLVRATRAGFYQWERGSRSGIYSGRLKEMLGYAPDHDTSAWPPFSELIHPEDRERRVSLFQDGVRDRSARGGEHRPGKGGDFRLRHANGEYLWVHAQGLFLHDASGRTTRYISSLVDVSERYRQQEALRASHNQIQVQAQQLRDQNEALRAAIRVREEVERMARHDIKTPLNTIVAVPRMLREARRRAGGAIEPREEELLGMVEAAAWRMLDMANLSVDLYRMEQGEYRFSPRAVDLVAVLEVVSREVHAHAATKGVRIEVTVDGAPAGAGRRAFAWAEELLCYSVIANLVKNAVEASPDAGTVSAALTTGAQRTVLRLHNQGVVPEPVRERFFEKYATSGKVGGFGLGTYSARLMARVQRGELAMHTSEAGGTVLELGLPALPAGVPAATAGERADAAAAAGQARPLPALRVLVVDDDEFNVAFVRGSLPTPPLTVASAINGRAGVDAARAEAFDVVFLDLEMPVMNGFDALAAIRALEAASGRPRAVVVAFSSFDDDTIRRRCVEAGFDAYLSKPAPPERIHEMLHAVAEGRPLSVLAAPAAGEAAEPTPEDPVDVPRNFVGAMPRYLESRRALAQELAAAAGAGDRRLVARLAHKLAGSFALYRFSWAAAASRAIRRDAESAASEALVQRCAELRAHLEQVKLRSAP
jgi:CheY-like chemotaxis protein/PAS domain-containing protein